MKEIHWYCPKLSKENSWEKKLWLLSLPVLTFIASFSRTCVFVNATISIKAKSHYILPSNYFVPRDENLFTFIVVNIHYL